MFQIGIVYEFQGEAVNAKAMYERVLKDNPKHTKIMTQLGWLYHQEGTPFHNVDTAIEHMKDSVDADPSDPQPWYLLGRCYMTLKEYKNAYSAYQQAVYRDEMNPSYWCSIGVLYYQIKQFRDALDAYSRSICFNPAQSEVWYDLGTLYESCKQLSDAFDAYSKAAELDPNNSRILERLTGLKVDETARRRSCSIHYCNTTASHDHRTRPCASSTANDRSYVRCASTFEGPNIGENFQRQSGA